MAGEIVASNDLLRDRSTRMRYDFNAGHALKLYQFDIPLAVYTRLADFTECTYPGYAEIPMAGKWRPVFKVENGQYQFSSVEIPFVSTGGSTQHAYGWYLVGGGEVKLSCRLPFPVRMNTGARVTLRIDCQTWALVIL